MEFLFGLDLNSGLPFLCLCDCASKKEKVDVKTTIESIDTDNQHLMTDDLCKVQEFQFPIKP